MKLLRGLFVYVVMATGLVFVVAMVFNLAGAVGVIRSLYRENNTMFWGVIALYAAIAVTVVTLGLRKRHSSRRRRE